MVTESDHVPDMMGDAVISFLRDILASRFRTLYIGVTNDIERRIAEHRRRTPGTFSARYRIDRSVHIEEFGDIRDAIRREKQLKGWRRERKVVLIESTNPHWKDLADPN
jgi:putative endonuclease